MNLCSIKSRAEKINDGFYKLLMFISTSTIYTENGVASPPSAMEYNGSDQSKNHECRLFHMLIDMKSNFMRS